MASRIFTLPLWAPSGQTEAEAGAGQSQAEQIGVDQPLLSSETRVDAAGQPGAWFGKGGKLFAEERKTPISPNSSGSEEGPTAAAGTGTGTSWPSASQSQPLLRTERRNQTLSSRALNLAHRWFRSAPPPANITSQTHSTNPLVAADRMLSPSSRLRVDSDVEPRAGFWSALLLLVVLAKFAALTDVFLSGLFVPLIPSIVAQRGGVTVDQVQMWTSVLISAYGGAFVAVSPLMPFLARKGPSLWAVLVAGLVCAGASLALLQLSSVLSLLVLARILQGLAGAAIAGACSALISTAIDLNGGASVLSWVTPALIQSAAMAVAPAVSGVLHDYAGGETAVFRCAYAVIAVNVVLGLLVFVFARVPAANRASGCRRDDGPAAHKSRAQNYGTVRLRGGGDMLMSGNSSRSSSPGLLSVSSRRSSVSSIHRDPQQPSPPGLRITTAVYGYLVVAFLGTALQSVLPIFVDKRFNWSTSAAGMMFVWLSGPAVLVGPLAGALSSRVTKTARYLAAVGFLACAPALMYLGRLPGGDSPAIQLAFLATLAGISVALGLCGDPLAREIRRVQARATRPFPAIDDDTSAGTQASNLPNLAHAWGSLTGPLVAGALAWVCGWKTMTKSLGLVSALSGLLTLLFLQGWIGSSFGAAQNGSHAYDSDEESSPLLHDSAHDDPEQFTSPRGRPGGFFDTVGSSVDSNSPHNTRAIGKSDDSSDAAREQGTSRYRAHRRQFSVDTFVGPSPSSSSKAASSSVSSDELFRTRFQAAIDLPVGAVLRPRNAEERFVMREAPHAPATDPRLAAGRRYVLDMEQPSADGGKEMVKRHVIVFEEGQVPPGMLQRREHHTVSVNRRASGGDNDDEAAVLAGKDDHTMRVAEETGAAAEQTAFRDESAARYVVVLLEKGDDDALASSEESR